MFWEDEEEVTATAVSDDVVDLVFGIECRCLPVDHAHALLAALSSVLPWFAGDPGTGLHTIHGAESGNGWYRPEQGDELLFLSRRTRLVLRLPRERIEAARALSGTTLSVAGHGLAVGSASVRRLSPHDTLYARYVAAEEGEDEQQFLAQAAEQLIARGMRVKKLLAGRVHRIDTPDRPLFTRSLMVADLNPEQSIQLQKEGLGGGRKLGCGLFVPHKAVRDVYRS
jgi:CRISPR-associated protein Cas6